MSDFLENLITRNNTPSNADFFKGVAILVDKPKDWTSFDVVNKIRGKLRFTLKVKKIKVGHSGTLDPMATGLMLVCVGKYTKLLHEMQNLDKVYTGCITLGATTPSYDAESEIDQHFPIDHITIEKIEEHRKLFIGEIDQVPPMFSAIKIKGQPLYKIARRGGSVELKARRVTIFDFRISDINIPELTFYTHVSKGTYIRSLAFDFGKSLDSGAYLSALRREQIAGYNVKDALTIEEVAEWIETYDALDQ